MASNSYIFQNYDELNQWYQGIVDANRNNIFCHCRTCGYEWMDSTFNAICIKCNSKNIEAIAAWQFPDD